MTSVDKPSRFLRTLRVLVIMLAALGIFGVPEAAAGVPTTAAYEVSSSIVATKTFALPHRATHLALHWRGDAHARVRIAFSRDGNHFDRARLVQLDEVGEQLRNGETYGAMMVVPGVKAVRVSSDRPLARLTLLALTDRGPALARPSIVRTFVTVAQPNVIPRAGWGADESLRFDSTGKEIWPPTFWPIQKLIVHHTATTNNDPDPAATIRSIYYYHAVTQGFGDIGYNFLIDEAGNISEGRYSRSYAPGESPTGEDLSGNGVTGAHALNYNSGTVGIALLGTLTNQDATPAARSALERLLAWIVDTHGIDPQGSALYTNPVNGLQAPFPNIAGHRDVAPTECPGGVFSATLPTVRSDVASLIAPPVPDFSLAASPSSASTNPGGSVTYSVSLGSLNGFTGSVGLSVSGLPAGATGTFTPASVAAPGSSTLSVATSSSTSPGSYPLTITGTSGSLTHTTSVTLVVSTPDFSLSASPTSRSVRRGKSTTFTVTIGRTGGFTDAVSFSVSGLPAGATSSFSANPATSSSSTLSVSTRSSTPTGTYSLTITGVSASLTRTTKVTLVVKPPSSG